MRPIDSEPACSQAACHVHPGERNIIVVLGIAMDLSHLDQEVAGICLRVLLMTLASNLLTGIFFAIFLRVSYGKPNRRLIQRGKMGS